MLRVSDLRSRGASSSEISQLRKSVTKVRHGVYTQPVDDAWELYRLRCRAVLDSHKSSAALAGPSAAVFWNLPLVGEPPSVVYVRGVTRGSYARDVKPMSGGTAQFQEHDGVKVTSVAWTVADCARVLPRRDALIVADASLHLRRCSLDDLEVVVAQLGRAKGVGRVRWIVGNADPKG